MTRPRRGFLFFVSKKKWSKSRQKRSSNTSKSINDKFLSCEFNVNPSFHLLAVAGKDQAPRYVDCRRHWPRVHAGDVPPPHHRDERVGRAREVAPERRLPTKEAQELSDYTARFRQITGYSSVQVQRVPTNTTDPVVRMTPLWRLRAVTPFRRLFSTNTASEESVSSGFQKKKNRQDGMYVFRESVTCFMRLCPKTYAERSASIF